LKGRFVFLLRLRMALPNTNLGGYLNYHYGRVVLRTYDCTKKAHEHYQSVLVDLRFLKCCRSNDIIPKFLWFKTANQGLSMSAAYKECQRRLLNVEIDAKYRELNISRKSYSYFLNELKQSIPDNVFNHILEYIINRSRALLFEKEVDLEQKIYSLEFYQKKVYPVDRSVVNNLSSRVLTNEEIDCLAHGLDYGLIPKKVDDMNIITNIENFFHRITDISQHHKKLFCELRDRNTVIDSDIRVLSSNEMTLASSLRSITDSFRFQAYRSGQSRNAISTEQEIYRHLLKKLKEDTSIIITRPDKGRGIVLLNKTDYLSKMQVILNDSTKFKCLSNDPTISREAKLIKLLNRLFKEGHISEQFLKVSKPTGSTPGRLYGLPKVHKKDVPLRPVLSAIGTFNYGLGKALSQLLSTIIKKENMVRDSFTFVQELLTLPKSMSQHRMVSFDVSSLYTNVPLDETIDIILKHLYDSHLTPPTMNRTDMKQLLDLATKESHFLFDGKLYGQIDGVSMGSPLAPLLAEIFLQDFERKHLSSLKNMGIVYWKRYVDDTFVLLDSKISVKNICHTLSQYHPSLKFTYEQEKLLSRTLPFLEVLVQRLPGVGFQTRIYRKPTFSGLITKWDSFVPKVYKYNAISTMVYRAIKICSSHTAIHREFKFIRSLAVKNGYPHSIVDSIIRRQLSILYTPPTPKPPTPPNNDTVLLRVPYYGPLSQVYAKRITSSVIKNYPSKQIRVIYDVKERVGSGFTLKDPIPEPMKAGIVYEATCPECKMKYIGKTFRHFKTRIHEHLNDQKKDLCLKKLNQSKHTVKRNSSTLHTTIKCNGPVTRSQTHKLPPISITPEQKDINELVKNPKIIENNSKPIIPKTAIAKHYFTTGHIFNNNDFTIRLNERHKYQLLIKESILIRASEPELNKGIRSVPLYIYPDGIQQDNKNKM
jgi:hypothetical protein